MSHDFEKVANEAIKIKWNYGLVLIDTFYNINGILPLLYCD